MFFNPSCSIKIDIIAIGKGVYFIKAFLAYLVVSLMVLLTLNAFNTTIALYSPLLLECLLYM